MGKGAIQAWASWARRAIAVASVALAWLIASPASALEIAPPEPSGACDSWEGAAMTPDARAFLLSIELQALREIIARQESEASECSDLGACDDEEDATAPQAPRPLAATLLIEARPSGATPARSCMIGDDGLPTCERGTPPAHRLTLASIAPAAPSHEAILRPSGPIWAHTLALEPIATRRLVHDADGHVRLPERPPSP